MRGAVHEGCHYEFALVDVQRFQEQASLVLGEIAVGQVVGQGNMRYLWELCQQATAEVSKEGYAIADVAFNSVNKHVSAP